MMLHHHIYLSIYSTYLLFLLFKTRAMEIKQRIIQKIQKLEDPKMLDLLESWLDASSDLDNSFSSEELEAVEEGYAEYKSGKLLDHNQVQEHLKKWLREE